MMAKRMYKRPYVLFDVEEQEWFAIRLYVQKYESHITGPFKTMSAARYYTYVRNNHLNWQGMTVQQAEREVKQNWRRMLGGIYYPKIRHLPKFEKK